MSLLALVVLAAAVGARELDPGACAARFDLRRDKIIRTEESRAMGARYLSELDVGSRQECRRLCCETDTCDVFVYEEKSPGSCYLFKCGPPEDFRCKFTTHGNFSSGVLALSRRLAELQDQERLAAPPPPAAPAPAPPRPTPHRAPPPATTTTPAPRLVQTPAPAPPVAATTHAPPIPHRTPSGRCSRYQWECHSGSECIAVYNACDGVPQCADGSDEAPELGCPPAPAAPPAPPHSPPAPSTPPQLYPPQMQPQPYEMEGGEAPAGEGAGGGGGGGGPRWPHRLLQAQPDRYPAPPAAPVPPQHLHTMHTDGMMPESGGVSSVMVGGGGAGEGEGAAGGAVGAPHIFSHAGGLLQEPYDLPPAPAPWPRRYNQHTGAEGMPWGGGAGGWGRGPWDERRVWPNVPPPAPPRDPVQEMPYLGDPEPDASRTAPETLSYGAGAGAGAGGGGATHDAPKKGPPPARPAPPADRQDTTEHHPTQEHKQTAAAKSPRVQGDGGVVLAARGGREGDGPSERPAAALLLLVLGVCMTGLLGVVWGCGGRAGRRRRGARPLQHDADYLVNGMYL